MGLIDNKSALVQVMAWRQAITWTNDDPVQWRIYAALGGDELMLKIGIILAPLQLGHSAMFDTTHNSSLQFVLHNWCIQEILKHTMSPF